MGRHGCLVEAAESGWRRGELGRAEVVLPDVDGGGEAEQRPATGDVRGEPDEAGHAAMAHGGVEDGRVVPEPLLLRRLNAEEG